MFGRVYLEMRLTQLPSEHALRRFRVQSYGSTKLAAGIVVEGRGLWGWALGASGFGFKGICGLVLCSRLAWPHCQNDMLLFEDVLSRFEGP